MGRQKREGRVRSKTRSRGVLHPIIFILHLGGPREQRAASVRRMDSGREPSPAATASDLPNWRVIRKYGFSTLQQVSA